MSLVCILGDTHIGCRGDSPAFHRMFEKFYLNTFFPYLIKHDIKVVYQLGDLFDRRKYINFQSLDESRKYFFDKFKIHNIKLVTLLGNHDIYYKDTLRVNSPSLLLGDLISSGVVDVIDKPIKRDGMDIIPWLCDENQKEIMEFMSKSSSRICINHFELNGFEMDKGVLCEEGLDRGILKQYDMVLCGHFHHKSSDGHITYVGSPCEYTWIDCDDPKGFHILDTKTLDLKYITNPFKTHLRILFDADTFDLKLAPKDLEFMNIKVVVLNRGNGTKLDKLMAKLQSYNPNELSIVEDNIGAIEENEESEVDQSDDTLTILKKYVDSLTMERDHKKIKQVITDAYNDAIKVDQS